MILINPSISISPSISLSQNLLISAGLSPLISVLLSSGVSWSGSLISYSSSFESDPSP